MSGNPPWDLGRYRPVVRLLAAHMAFDPRLRSRFDQSDLAHEALVRAQQHLGQCKAETEGERIAWLQAILRNTLIDLVRKYTGKNRDARLEQSIHEAAADSLAWLEQVLSDQGTAPPERAEKFEQLAVMGEALDTLPTDQREAVVQKHLRGRTVKEIAEAMGKTPKAVVGLLERGLCALQKEMEARYPDGQSGV